MRVLQGLRAVLDLPLENMVREGDSGAQDEFDIPRPEFEIVQEPNPGIIAELGLDLSEPGSREPVRYHHPSLHELQTSRFSDGAFLGAILEATKGEKSYEFRFGRDNRGPHITLSTENDAEELEALAFAVRVKTGGYFAVHPVQGAVVRDRKGLFTTLYLVPKGHDFTDRSNPNMKARIEAAEDPAVYHQWVETFEHWNPKNARTDFRANGKPQPEGITSRFVHPRMYMPEPIAFSQNNVVAVMEYLAGLGFDMKINQVDYTLSRSEREHSSFVQDLMVR